jgi:hypothetical protein
VPHPERVAQRSRRASKTSRARCARIGKAPRPVLAAGVFDLSNSESPQFIGRAVAALAGDPGVLRWSGQVVVAAALAQEYGFTDLDGRQPRPLTLADV